MRKYNQIKSKLFRQQYVVNSLLAEYKKIYGENLRIPKERGAEMDGERKDEE